MSSVAGQFKEIESQAIRAVMKVEEMCEMIKDAQRTSDEAEIGND